MEKQLFELQRGEVLDFKGTEYVFIEMARTRAKVIARYNTTMSAGSLRANNVTVTGEFDMDRVNAYVQHKAKRANAGLSMEMELRGSVPGRKFIGNDGKTYYYKKFNRTRFEFTATPNVNTDYRIFSAPATFVREFVEEGKE